MKNSNPSSSFIPEPHSTHGFTTIPKFIIPLHQRPEEDLSSALYDESLKLMIEKYTTLRIKSTEKEKNLCTSITLYGADGSGKSHLALIIANSLHATIVRVSIKSILDSPTLLENVIHETRLVALVAPVCLIFDDEELLDFRYYNHLGFIIEKIMNTCSQLPLFFIFVIHNSSYKSLPSSLKNVSSLVRPVSSPSVGTLQQALNYHLNYRIKLSGFFTQLVLDEEQVSHIMNQIIENNCYRFSVIEKFVRNVLDQAISRIIKEQGVSNLSEINYNEGVLVLTPNDIQENLKLFKIEAKEKENTSAYPFDTPRHTCIENSSDVNRENNAASALISMKFSSEDTTSESSNDSDDLPYEPHLDQIDLDSEKDEPVPKKRKNCKVKRKRKQSKNKQKNTILDAVNNYNNYLFHMNDSEKKSIPPSSKHDMEVLWFGYHSMENFDQKFNTITAARNYVRSKMSNELAKWREAGKPVEKDSIHHILHKRFRKSTSSSSSSYVDNRDHFSIGRPPKRIRTHEPSSTSSSPAPTPMRLV